MANLKVVAEIAVKADKVDFVKAEMIKLIDTTRAEQGCLQYELHQNNDDPSKFIFCETWDSEASLKQHLANDHIVAYSKATEGYIEDFVINKLTLVK